MISKHLIIAILAVPLIMAAENLLSNPGFENGKIQPGKSKIIDDWAVRGVNNSRKFHNIDTTVAHSGKNSARIDVTETGGVGYFTPEKAIKADTGGNYRLTFYARYPEQPAGSEAYARLTLLDSAQKPMSMGSIKTLKIPASPDWIQYSIDYKVPEKDPAGYYFRLQLSLKGSGTVWYDDVTLESIDLPKSIVEFYPASVNTAQTLYPIRGGVSHLLFYSYVGGPRDGYQLTVDVPEQFPLLEAVPVQSGQAKTLLPELVRRDGRLIYTINLSATSVRPISALNEDLATGYGLLFNTASNMTDGELHWSLLRNGQNVNSGKLKLAPLNPVSGKCPRNFSLFSWYSPFLNTLSPAGVESWLKELTASGVTAGNLAKPNLAEITKREGFKNIRSFWYRSECTTELLNSDKFEKFVNGRLNEIKGFHEPALNWNYEPGLDQYYHFCDQCRKAFERHSGLTTSGINDGRSAEKKYPAEFLKFRNSQQEQIMQNYARWCGEAGVKSMFCSYTVNQNMSQERLLNLQRRLGDLPSYRSIIDFYLPQVYFAPTQLWDNLKAMLAFYPGSIPVFTSDERHNRDTYPYSLLTPEDLRLEVLMTAAQGCRQIGMFVGYHTFDGRQINELRRTMNDIVQYEDFFFSGTDADKLLKYNSHQLIRARLLEHSGKYLLAVFNPDPYQKHRVEVTLPTELKQLSISDPEKNTILPITNDKIIFTVPATSARLLTLSAPSPEDRNRQQEPVDALASLEPQNWDILSADGWQCQATGTSKDLPATVTVSRNQRSITVDVSDNAVISAIAPDKIIHEGGLFRDLFWHPQSARWSPDAKAAYRFDKAEQLNGELHLAFSYEMKFPVIQGLTLQKTYIIEPDLKAIRAAITITNHSKQEMSFTYWSHHRPAVKRSEAVYEIAGQPPFVAADTTEENNYLKVIGSQWIKLSKKIFFGWDDATLDKFYLWTGSDYPTLEMIGAPTKLKPGSKWSTALSCRILEAPNASVFTNKFTLENPYSARKNAWRASLHNHAQYAPSYTHAPVPPAERLQELRDKELVPPYRIASITEHNRVTLPANTTPVGQEPQWGVTDFLYVPGIEKTMGSVTVGSDCGKLFGELNVVGASRQFGQVDDQKTYPQNRWKNAVKASEVLADLIADGTFVGLCHPNSRMEADGSHRWKSAGYNYDELDLIFGNPEKGLKTFPVLPHAVEIGNQGYDFSERSNFTNAEDKWDMLLARGHRLLGTAGDDAHHKAPCAGWIVIYMDELTQDDFMRNLKSGNYYSSQGPQITAIKVQDKTVTLETDQPALIEFIGRGGQVLKAAKDSLSASYTAMGDEIYIRGRITRDCPEMREVGGNIGHRRSAWTNPFYLKASRE